MSIRRITISVPDKTAARIKKAAGAMAVSAWVTGIIEERLEDAELDRLWQEFYRSVQPRGADVRRANAMFKRLTRTGRRNRAA
jgi:sirohydrochlorin ferrochelatase